VISKRRIRRFSCRVWLTKSAHVAGLRTAGPQAPRAAIVMRGFERRPSDGDVAKGQKLDQEISKK